MRRQFRQIFKMKNPIQTYAWGSHTAIAALLGDESPSTEPQAELWMGAHLKSPSKVFFDSRWVPLSELIGRYPTELLGRKVAEKFDRSLPFLFKVLAAAEPLSIQAHPDAQQAVDGFQRENLKGLSLSDPQRNYRDDRPKPECLCALAPFTGLCGFRTPEEILSVSAPVWPKDDTAALDIVHNTKSTNGLHDFFLFLMQLDKEHRTELTARVVESAAPLEDQNEAYRWVSRLNKKYLGDIGVLSPLMLNLITLQPNEAVYLPPRQLHAYLDGIGIEVMANSDNVLRGGLTPKHVDLPELTKILDFHPHKPEILTPKFRTESQGVYDSSSEAFCLTLLTVTGRRPLSINARFQGPEIILAIKGKCGIRGRNDQNDLTIEQGESVFIPAAVETYTLSGDARLFRAAVNLTAQEVKRQS